MSIAEPPTAPAIAEALARIAALRAEGWALVYPEQPTELARLVRGRELIIVRAER